MSSTAQTPGSQDGEPPASGSAAPTSPAPGLRLTVQRVCDAADLPDDDQLAAWVRAALAGGSPTPGAAAALTLRIVDADEGATLNATYRGKTGPTNVLAFPFAPPAGLPPEALDELDDELGAELGDVVICAAVLRREAAEQRKTLTAHTAHLLVHGTLHLLGYDHVDPREAARMEAVETAILAGLGFSTPYEVPEEPHDERSSA